MHLLIHFCKIKLKKYIYSGTECDGFQFQLWYVKILKVITFIVTKKLAKLNEPIFFGFIKYLISQNKSQLQILTI